MCTLIIKGNENNVRTVVVRTDELLQGSHDALDILIKIEENPNTYKKDIVTSVYVQENESGAEDREISETSDALMFLSQISPFTCFYISCLILFIMLT